MSEQPPKRPERVDKHQAAEIMCCSPSTVVQMAASGRLAAAGAARINGGKWSFNEARLRAYVEAKEAEARREADAANQSARDFRKFRVDPYQPPITAMLRSAYKSNGGGRLRQMIRESEKKANEKEKAERRAKRQELSEEFRKAAAGFPLPSSAEPRPTSRNRARYKTLKQRTLEQRQKNLAARSKAGIE